jgi:hypothetical protein
MKNIFKKHRTLWLDRYFAYSAAFGLIFFFLSLYVNRLASIYALQSASNAVNDIILDNTPVIDVNLIVTTGAFLFFLFITLMTLTHPKKLPFLLKSAALFIVIRSIFITLTHLGPMPYQSYIDPTNFFSSYNLGTDYFFSGHTGLPFLMSLIFWDKRWIRYVALACSLVFGTSVLLGHLHYSIDVFAAFFITYTIFVIAQKLFPKDYSLSIK